MGDASTPSVMLLLSDIGLKYIEEAFDNTKLGHAVRKNHMDEIAQVDDTVAQSNWKTRFFERLQRCATMQRRTHVCGTYLKVFQQMRQRTTELPESSFSR